MRVTIWDMDYYYAKDKKNCFNPDAMKISSYHKQLGDAVNFVTKEADINRPYDLVYIIKNDKKLPHPPKNFFFDTYKVRWWGKAYEARIKWRMTNAMLGCRPDYLLYPEKETKLERSEQIRFFNFKAEPIPISQEYKNTFRNKYAVITDTCMWFAKDNFIIDALKLLKDVKNVSFLEPIWIEKLISNKEIKDLFFELNFIHGSQINWFAIDLSRFDDAFKLISEFKEKFPNVMPGKIEVDYRDKSAEHWTDHNAAKNDFRVACELIKFCKDNDFAQMEIRMPAHRFETPYFFIFEELGNWVKWNIKCTWLEYISYKWSGRWFRPGLDDTKDYWWRPQNWNPMFRDLLRQTYDNDELMRHRWKDEWISKNLIPLELWKDAFKLGI